MDFIKRKIRLEDGISRNSDYTYGTLTGDSFYIKIMITQSGDDMGIFNTFDSSATPLTGNALYNFDENNEVGIRYITDSVSKYTTSSHKISGLTEDRLEEVKSYNENELYIPDFDIKRETYQNFEGTTIDGVDRVTNVTGDGYEYVIDTSDSDVNIGSPEQNSGFYFKTFTAETRNVTIFPNINLDINRTEIYYNAEGWNESNVSHLGLSKEEYLFGITSEPQVFSDVLISRGVLSPREKHLKLSEVKSLEDLVNYGNGFFNVKK